MKGCLPQELPAKRHAARHRGVCRSAGVYSIVVAVKMNELNQCDSSFALCSSNDTIS